MSKQIHYNIDNIDIYNSVGDIIKSLKNRLKLDGYYKVEVCNKKIGTFIIIKLIEKSLYSDVLDLEIELLDNIDIYYKTDNYYKILEFNNIWYYNNMYYCLINDDISNIIDMIEFGDLIIGNKYLDFICNNFDAIVMNSLVTSKSIFSSISI